MESIIFAVPPVVTVVMFIAKKLAGLSMFANGATPRPALRFALIAVSLIGIVSTSIVLGATIDADSVSTLVTIAFETAVSSFGSHWLYVLLRWIAGR